MDVSTVLEHLRPISAAVWAFIAGFAVATIFASTFGRAPIRLLRPLFSIVGLPFRPFRFILRRTKVLPETAIRARREAGAAVTAALESQFGSLTEVEKSLQLTNGAHYFSEGEDGAEPPELELHDFNEEGKFLKREGFIFRSIQVTSAYFPETLIQPLNEKIADEYIKEASEFFSRQVPLFANERALYEDVEGAFIIELFRNSDRRCFYVLDLMRKAINGNARQLILLNTGILFVCAAAVFTVFAPPGALPFIPSEFPHYSGVAACVFAIVLMHIYHNTGYQKHQQHNTRELRSFLTRYLGRISDRYREACGIAKGVTVGDETDSKVISERARKWHKIVIWMPFRAFFIESFVRSVLYQIRRNCGYYMYILPAALFLLAAVALAYFAIPSAAHAFFAFGGREHPLEGPILLLSLFVVAAVYVERINKVVIEEELNQTDWLGYDNLKVSDEMDNVVGKYAEDVGFWKGRLDR